MKHIKHCSFCGESFKKGYCKNKQCQRSEKELPFLPWDRCYCGERMFNHLSWMQILKISWLGGVGLIVFILSLFALNFMFSLLGIGVVTAWFMQRQLLLAEFKTENKQMIQELIREEKTADAKGKKLSPQEEKELKDEGDKIKGYQARLWGIRLYHKIIVMAVIFAISSVYLLSSFSVPTLFDSTKEKIKSNFVAVSEKLDNSILKLIKKEAGWQEKNMLRLKHVLMDKRNFSFDQFQEIRTILSKYPVGYKEVMDIVDNSRNYGDDLYGEFNQLLPQIIANKDKKVSKPKNKEEIEKSYFQKLHFVFKAILFIVDVFMFLVIISFIAVGGLAFILSHLYFVLDETWDRAKAGLANFLEKREKAPKTKSKNRAKTKEKSGVMDSIIGSTLSAIPAMIIESYGRRIK